MTIDDKFAPLGTEGEDRLTISAPFDKLMEKIADIAMHRIGTNGKPSIWYSELCTILGTPQPLIDRIIYFDMDSSMFRAYVLNFEKNRDVCVEIFSNVSFVIHAKPDALYKMQYENGKWCITVKSDEPSVVSTDFLMDIDTLCALVHSF